MLENLGPSPGKFKGPGISEKKTYHFKNDRLAVGTTPEWGLFCTVSFLFSKKELVQSQVAGQWVRHTCLTMPVKDMSLPSLKPIQSDLVQKISRKGRYLERTSLAGCEALNIKLAECETFNFRHVNAKH